MVLGAFVAAVFADTSPLEGVRQTADQVLPGSGLWLLVAALPGLISVITVNIYAACMELITMIDSVKSINPTRTLRIIGCTIIAAAAVTGSLLSTGAFLDNFGSFLVILLYVLVPWTSVNLVDFYFVRRGHYAIREIFNRDGIYGSWGWRGLLAYLIGILAMIPFAVTSWYTGPVANALGGADIALFVGLAASALSSPSPQNSKAATVSKLSPSVTTNPSNDLGMITAQGRVAYRPPMGAGDRGVSARVRMINFFLRNSRNATAVD